MNVVQGEIMCSVKWLEFKVLERYLTADFAPFLEYGGLAENLNKNICRKKKVAVTPSQRIFV